MANMGNKPLVWLKGEVKTPPFSSQARLEAGLLLRRLQQGQGLSLPHSRPMPAIGRKCHELRISDREQTWRIIYHVGSDAIVVLDVFSKKTQATPGSDRRSLPKAPGCLLASDFG
jgi:phage-related protein